MKYFVYILLCDQKTFYIDITKNLEKRLLEHKSKQSFFTKKFFDIVMVYSEQCDDLQSATKREKQLKGWSFAKKKALIEKDYTKLKNLAEQ